MVSDKKWFRWAEMVTKIKQLFHLPRQNSKLFYKWNFKLDESGLAHLVEMVHFAKTPFHLGKP